ncbi:hypothetical protein OGM63_28195 [Plectonema radiosum NIES-515]|uniref:Uncharacterized protein n=1 Tax=Plectonema radiosum NIES-515 TaxID=2986073 RepID=A0ABT3B8U5_9CYAN|nr:hypothetical protein [Plectonema radiosum]MCV3217344.1 hypothetical protein [Plectonema radiosum NIES-515]
MGLAKFGVINFSLQIIQRNYLQISPILNRSSDVGEFLPAMKAVSTNFGDQIPRGVQAPKFIYGGKPQAISIAVKFRFDFEYTF